MAVAEVAGPAEGLRLVSGLALETYPALHAVRADLLARLGRADEAAQEWLVAADLSGNEQEATHLRKRAAAVLRRAVVTGR